MAYPTASRLRGMSLPDLVAALVVFRAFHGLPCAHEFGKTVREVCADFKAKYGGYL